MIPGLHLPPKHGAQARVSFWGSLRPNARSLRPAVKAEATGLASKSRIVRWQIALGCVLACAAVADVVVWTSLPHARVKIVQSVVSGRAGLRKTSAGAVEHWPSAAVTVTIDPTLAHATPAAKDAIANAIGAWVSSGASLPELSFDATSTPGDAARDGVNRLLLGPITVPGHEADLAVTISYADTATGMTIEADTIFNNAYEWTSVGPASGKDSDDEGGCKRRYDLQNVATHEAGHFFGLGEDFDDPSTTMYVSSLPCQTSKRTLSKVDVAVMSDLYTQAALNSSPTAACGARIASGRDTNGAALLTMGVAFALARRHRRACRGPIVRVA